ncbi:hypothetical protein A8H39_01700 [Paraburkholderia fungorum]|uniref:hypothetical protein n=1 Tax=Paraburkholderia fungorum TaxID=134537 RepID=UPI000485E42A|nr:hypothetical protein [Paraburkholderia fungorum]MBB5546638.1 hypothetical protein [Paraburkholderia fungorum]PNE59886.1 hypothetical protein A8H39_01700 [Paraburkholderia fungorum]
MECKHYREWQAWIEVKDPYSGEATGMYHTHTESLDEDIDLHRFRCRQCGRIGYYSGAARAFYEQRIKSPGILGLE